MKISKPWAAKGVALYPPNFCMVGQNPIFNALHQFRRSFWDGSSQDIAGFFVAFGDWGLGKTRLGYELVAEATGQVDEWLLNPNEHIIAPFHRADTKARVLEPALKDGVLPLYVRYSSVCDEDLDAASWVSRLAVEALQHTIDASPAAGGPLDLQADLQSALHAKGVNLDNLGIGDDSMSLDERLRAAMEVLQAGGIKQLWIIVDEVETPGDLKHGLREDTPTHIDDEYLLMVPEVIKHESWRAQHPYVNFLLLCSLGMRDQIHIGPNLRRATSVTLEPNQVTDVQSYVKHIQSALSDPTSVDYPVGTLEGAFLAANRNFGWLNVLMAAVHETCARHRERDETVQGWELLRDFAKTHGSARHIFNDNAVLPLIGNVEGVPKNEVERLIYGQLPIVVGGPSAAAVTPPMADALLEHEIAGRGQAFAELIQVHIAERGLANELMKPDVGFKPREGQTDTYFTLTCEMSVVGLLEALRAFSVKVGGSGDTGDFVIYIDLEQWAEQLGALYPREGIEFAAEALHRIFTKPEYRVEDTRFIGMSFRLWREFNKLLVTSAESVRFFKDGKYEHQLEQYVREANQTRQKLGSAVCLGLAKLLDEQLTETRQAPGLSDISHQILVSRFVSPALDGLRVTSDGRTTIVYCQSEQLTVARLKSFIGLEPVQPILVLFPATADVAAFDELLDALPTLNRCIVTRRLVSQEEEFLLRYSGRGEAFDPHTARLSKVANGRLKSYQDEWQARTREWSSGLRKTGYLLAPVWSQTRVINTADFAKGYRYMLAKNCSLDAAHEDAGGPLNDVEFENCRQAAKKNVNPPATWKNGDLLGVLTTDATNLPLVPPCFFGLLKELRTQSSASKLAKRFFFAVSEMKATKQLEQVLELLVGVGVVQKTGDLYRAVDRDIIAARRQSASTWLKEECKGAIKKLEDLFPTQAGILMNATYPDAGVRLQSAESQIARIDFGLLTASDIESVTEDGFRQLVKGITEVEAQIIGVCPLDIRQQAHQPFDCLPARIIHYETRYNQISLWEKVSFLLWLKKTFLGTRGEMLQEIDEILGEAGAPETADGEPFPVAPLTLPLKAIKSELENAIKGPVGGTGTRMAKIKVAKYALLVDQYFVASNFDDAWKRVDALRGLISKDHPRSFFVRFTETHEQWAGAVGHFKTAEAEWDGLASFTADVPAAIASRLSELRATVKKYAGLVRGGLKQQIQNQTDDMPEADLLAALTKEVEVATSKLAGLESQVKDQKEELLKDLRQLIRRDELQALNLVLRAESTPKREEPSPGPTYNKTKASYEKFNGKVRTQGHGFFENAGKTAHWSLWVEIYSGLTSGTYDEDQHPDHAEAIRDLKAMKLIRSRLELR